MNTQSITFLLGVHNHQPVGNFGYVYEHAYNQAYAPFLDVMDRHPKIKFSMHLSGPLLEWLEANRPEYLERIKKLVREGRTEILGGAFYEAILPVLPECDQIGQLEKLNRYIQNRFGQAPQGAWLAERVWEPHMPKTLHAGKVKYTVLDDAHFITAGMKESDLTGYFITEDNLCTVAIFPINQQLRYDIPFAPPEKAIEDLKAMASDKERRALVMFDDGEKFGLWPGTHKHVYTDGWLDRFLTAVETADWINTDTFSGYLSQNRPRGRVYLPTGAYSEMGEWTYEAEAAKRLTSLRKELAGLNVNGTNSQRYLRGGMWRNFLTKYAEANAMHKKMLLVSSLVWKAMEKQSGSVDTLWDNPKVQEMVNALWAGQCNCAYWHGVFGGLYLPHLRHAVYKHLLEAERLADNIIREHTSNKNGKWSLSRFDYDADGEDELLISGLNTNLYILPSYGGAIAEWDRKDLEINLTNVISRKPEAYHENVNNANDPGRAEKSNGSPSTIHERPLAADGKNTGPIVYDWHRRLSFLEHFLHPGTTFDSFATASYGEQGDFVGSRYEPSLKSDYNELRVLLKRKGNVRVDNEQTPVLIEKEFVLTNDNPNVLYRLKNCGKYPVHAWFGIELVFGLLSRFEPNATSVSNHWVINDDILGIKIDVSCDMKLDWWSFPLETVSQSEKGIERTYQGSVLLAHQKLELIPDRTKEFRMKVEIGAAAK